MRKSSSTSPPSSNNKIYINSRGLCVNGERIKLEVEPKTKRHRQVQLEPSELERQFEVGTIKGVERRHQVRPLLKLNVCHCDNVPVQNKQVKRIREAVQVAELERFLNQRQRWNKGKVDEDDGLLVALGGVYDEFFGQYYEYLQKVVEDEGHNELN